MAERGAAPPWGAVVQALGTPVFVKPAIMGSSMGVSCVGVPSGYGRALDETFSFDTKAILERTIREREIELPVIGDRSPEASIPGEVVPRHDFYSYEAKYLDADGADLLIPADLDPATTSRAQDMAIGAFRALCCEGMARASRGSACSRSCGRRAESPTRTS